MRIERLHAPRLGAVISAALIGLAATGSAVAAPDPGTAPSQVDRVGAALVPPGLALSKELWTAPTLNAIADDIVGANDMVVAIEDDPAEWASIVGDGSESVLGFVVLASPPSPLYHAIVLGPFTYPVWNTWFSTGSPFGEEYSFAVSAMALIHESMHWRLMSGDEGLVNACALKYFPYYLGRDFAVPETVVEKTIQSVQQVTKKKVPVTKTVNVKKRVKVHGKWVTRVVRTHVTVYVTKTVTETVDVPVETPAPNPLYQTLVADVQDFFDHQPPEYTSGTCPN